MSVGKHYSSYCHSKFYFLTLVQIMVRNKCGILATAREMVRAVVLSYTDVRVRVWCWPGAGRGTHADTALDIPSIVVRCTRFDKVRQ